MEFPQSGRLPLYSAACVRAMDRSLIGSNPGGGLALMELAGLATFELISRERPDARTLSAVAGRGNNGGDAFVVARLALERGLDVRVYPLSETAEGDAALARERYLSAGGTLLSFMPEDFEGSEILVDGIFGTGLSRPIDGPEAAIIAAMRRYRHRGFEHSSNQRTIVALDLPSGLDADTGRIHGCAVEADMTITFIAAKPGLFTGQGATQAGRVFLADLGHQPSHRSRQQPRAMLVSWPKTFLPPRSRSAHKGDYGHVLVIGGSQGFAGAARLAGEAALRVGAGLVSLAAHPMTAGLIGVSRPELMVHAVADALALEPLLARATTVVVGPGLGQDDWALGLFERARQTDRPLIVDADGLNLLATRPDRRDHWLLTPHPGEAGRLLGWTTSEVEANRLEALKELGLRYGATVLLKGAGTLLGSAGACPEIIPAGNPGMASGGMGDVLSGLLGGLIAQGLDLETAARLGVLLHGAAGDLAAKEGGERGLLASDLFPWIRQLLNHPDRFQGYPPCALL